MREYLYKPNVYSLFLFEYGGREEQKDDQAMNETWKSCKATPLPSPHSYVSSSLHPKSPFYYKKKSFSSIYICSAATTTSIYLIYHFCDLLDFVISNHINRYGECGQACACRPN